MRASGYLPLASDLGEDLREHGSRLAPGDLRQAQPRSQGQAAIFLPQTVAPPLATLSRPRAFRGPPKRSSTSLFLVSSIRRPKRTGLGGFYDGICRAQDQW